MFVAVDSTQNHILQAVVKAMIIMEEVHGSQQDFMHILQYGKELYCKGKGCKTCDLPELWPTSWQSSMKLLTQNGYKSPVEYFVCLNDSHPCSFDVLKSVKHNCRFCHASGSSCIKYMYLPLKDKIHRWCQDVKFCHKITAHWAEKEHWLDVNNEYDGYLPKKEIWDGNRFSELAWFWNPSSQWLLPARCPLCRTVIPAEDTNGDFRFNEEAVNVLIKCPECHSEFTHEPKLVNGDPRNIALIGHWDGWQPFSTSSKHSSGICMHDTILVKCIAKQNTLHNYYYCTGAIEVSIATMRKADRCHTDEVYVCGFVPSYLLPNKRPNSLDPFLLPLIEEIEELFIEGNYIAIYV